MDPRNQRDEEEAIEALRFVKVTVRQGIDEHAGYLTHPSGALLLVELRREGFDLIRRR